MPHYSLHGKTFCRDHNRQPAMYATVRYDHRLFIAAPMLIVGDLQHFQIVQLTLRKFFFWWPSYFSFNRLHKAASSPQSLGGYSGIRTQDTQDISLLLCQTELSTYAKRAATCSVAALAIHFTFLISTHSRNHQLFELSFVGRGTPLIESSHNASSMVFLSVLLIGSAHTFWIVPMV